MSVTCFYCEKSSDVVDVMLQAPGISFCNECIALAAATIVSPNVSPRESTPQLKNAISKCCGRTAAEMTPMVILHGKNLCSSCAFSAFDTVLSRRDYTAKILEARP